MQITLTHVGAKFRVADPFELLTSQYLQRCSEIARCSAEAFRSESAFLDWLDRQKGRVPVFPVLLDSRGRRMSSESFAAWLGERRDSSTQHIVFAIGPADGWSQEARSRARLLLSFGEFTLAHALARLVMAEQLYRASSILTGHPYHSGH